MKNIINLSEEKKDKLEKWTMDIFQVMLMGILPLFIAPWCLIDRFYTPKRWLFYGMVILAIVSVSLLKRNYKIKILDINLAIFIVVLFLSAWFSSYRKIAFIGTANTRQPWIVFVAFALTFFMFYKHYKPNERNFKIILVIGCIISIYAIMQYFGFDPIKPDVIRKNWPKHPFATLGYRNAVGAYETIMVALAMTMYVKFKKPIYLISTAITFMGMLICTTRSSWVAISIMLFFLMIYSIMYKENIKRFITLVIVMIVIFIGINAISSNSMVDRAKSIKNDTTNITDASGTYRMYIWRRGIKLVPQHWLIGGGVDTFGVRYLIQEKDNIEEMVKVTGGIVQQAHNEYLQILCDDGILGLGVYLIFLIIIAIKLLKGIIKEDNPWCIILFMVIGSYAIQAFFNISIIGVAPIFWGMLGIAANVSEEDKDIFKAAK